MASYSVSIQTQHHHRMLSDAERFQMTNRIMCHEHETLLNWTCFNSWSSIALGIASWYRSISLMTSKTEMRMRESNKKTLCVRLSMNSASVFLTHNCIWNSPTFISEKQTNKQTKTAAWSYFWSPCTSFSRGGALNFFFGGCVPRGFQNVGSRERTFL